MKPTPHRSCARGRRIRTVTRPNQSGSALAVMMIVLAGLMPLGAFALMQARLDLLLQHNVRQALEAFYTAESGLEHAIADLAVDQRFERLLVGPDQIPGTADDQEFPFRIPPPRFFPRPPYRYEVSVARRNANTLDLVARGYGHGEVTRGVVASVVRAPDPYVPAALFSGARRPHLLLGNDFALSGMPARDEQRGLPALAAAEEDSARFLTDQLERQGRTEIEPEGVPARDLPVLEQIAAYAAGSDVAREIVNDASGPLGAGIFVSPGALDVTNVTGSGLLVVRGALIAHGTFDFSGVVIALGDIRFDRSSAVRIDGSLLQGREGDLLHLLGSGSIAYDPDTLAQLDAAFPGLLPHRAVITGRRELG